MSLIHNERVKHTCTYLNGIAIATFAVGSLAPLISAMNGSTATSPTGVALVSVICIAISIALHVAVRYFLGRLKP